MNNKNANQQRSTTVVFRANFITGLEEEGAAMAVYHNGKLVVDLWGGYADGEAAREWREDTLSYIFSSSKVSSSHSNFQ